MTCHRRFNWLLQATCLGLVGILAGFGCGGGSGTPKPPIVRDGGTADGKGSVPEGGPRDGGPSAPDLAVAGPEVAQLPVLKVSPAALPFGEVDVGSVSQTFSVTVTNSGALTAITPTVDLPVFGVVSTTCATPSASCTISIAFTPTAVGAASGTLTIATGLTVSLSGIGTPQRSFTATPAAIPATVLPNQAVPLTVAVVATAALTDLSCVSSSVDLTADPTTTTCKAAIPASTPCTFGFTFKATTAGAKNDAIVCSAGTTVRNVSVTTTVVTPASLTIQPNPGTFTTLVGGTSLVVTFNVGNVGGSPSGNLGTALGGANASEFSITDNKCVVQLAPGVSCAIQVVFKPTTPGNKVATITVTDSTVGSTPATANMTGLSITGGGANITGTGALGSVQVGQAGTPATFTVSNNGGSATGALTLASSDPQFTIGGDKCGGAPLAPTSTCTFTVTFSPTTAGPKTAVVTVSSGATVLGTIQVAGTGTPPPTPPALTMTPPRLDFGSIGVGTSSPTPQSFTVTNTGGRATGTLTVANVPVGGGTSQFSSTTNCPSTLDAGATCQVVVTYKPTVLGDASATFTVSDGTYSTPDRIVVGTALTSPGLSLTCPSTDFEDTVVGGTSTAKVCTVSNATGSALASGTLTFAMTGDFATTAGTTAADCSGKSLSAGDQCTVSVVFKPTLKGDRTGSIKVTGGNGGTSTRNLTGTGLGVIEIRQYTLSGYDLTAVSTTNPAFPFSVSPGARSDAPAILAVFVRGAVGNLTVATTDFTTITTPADFEQGTGSVNAIWTTGAANRAVAACVVGTTTTAPTPSNDVPYCTMAVSFTPQIRTPAQKSGTVTASGSTTGTDTATIVGTVGGPISITPSTLTFTKVAVGAVGTAMTLTVCNTGTVAATRAQFAITGTNAADFAVTLDEVSYATIAANGTPCVHLGLRLDIPAGTAVGALSATVTVTARIGTGATAPETDTATLTGTVAGAPVLTVPSSPQTFADTAVTATSPAVTIAVGNTGATATDALTFTILDGSEFTMVPPAGQSQGTCVTDTTCTAAACAGRALVATTDTCTLKVWFKPTGNLGVGTTASLGARSDALMVSSDNAGAKFVTLNGNASSQLTATPATSVVNGDTTIATITAANHGAAITGGLTVTLDDDVNFQKVSNNCLNPLASGTPAPTCTVGVELTTAAAGDLSTHSTIVRLINDSNGQMATVVVTGTGSSAASLQFSPATNVVRDFGAIRKGTTSGSIKYTVTNVGGVTSGKMTFGVFDSPVTAGSSASTDFTFATGTTCVSGATTGTALAPGASCDIMLAFSPVTATATTPLSESLVVRADPGAATLAGLQSPVINALATASAVVYMVTSATATPANAAPYDFGIHTPSTTAQTIQLAIHNAGTTAVRALPPTFKNVADALTNDEFGVVTGAGLGNCDFSGTGMALDPNQVCTFTAGWTPGTTVGPRAVVASSTMDSAAVASMVLFGRVPGPAVLTATPTTFEFGDVPQDVNSPTLTVVVKNTSEWAVHGNLGVTKTGAGAGQVTLMPSSTCDGAPLLAGATCNVVARVNPTDPVAGPTAGIMVQSGTLASETKSIPVHWNGMNPPLINRSATTLNFSSNAVLTTSIAQTVTLTNPTGDTRMPTGPLTFSIGGTDAADFAVQAGTTGTNCGNVNFASKGLDPTTPGGNGGFCSVVVTFTPRTIGTNKSGTLTVMSTSGVSATVALSGNATSALTLADNRPANSDAEDRLRTTGGGAGCALTGGTCAYGGTDVSAATTFDSETFIFQNAAGSPPTGQLMVDLTGTGTNAAEDVAQFVIVNDGCSGKSVDNGARCNVTVRFQPVTVGNNWTVTLTVKGTPGDSASVTLTGNGT